MKSKYSSTTVRGERALQGDALDRLGFKDVAKRIAASLTDHASNDGFVIGIDGRWGSGKSSLLHLIASELGRCSPDARPTIISFSPWLVGNRDALMTALFIQLAEAIDKVELTRGDATGETKRKAKKAAERMRKFAASVSRAGEFIQAISFLAGWLKPVGTLLTSLSSFAKKQDDVQLDVLKRDLVEALRDLNHRFIVTIDDVDRLEPSEVVEVLRLVRSVADFPNIIYLLCYDSAILAESVKRGANVADGAAYLQKIVQLSVMVPRPEPFQLRQWFADDLARIVESIPDDQLRRLRTVIDQEGGIHLHTPRAVVRTLDSVRFFWPALKHEGVDIPDLVWLLLIKDGAPDLYRWIESYLGSAAIIQVGIGTVSDAGRDAELASLMGLIDESRFSDMMYRHSFAEQLPGVEVDYDKNGRGFKLYQKQSQAERDDVIANRRLASPDHFRLYLALIGPSHVITRQQADAFWNAVAFDAEKTGDSLLALGSQPLSHELSKLDLLLERLNGSVADNMEPLHAENIVLAFSNVMDQLDASGDERGFMVTTTWDRAERIVDRLLKRIDTVRRTAIIDRMFRTGVAIGWLSSLLRSETFGHGRFGNQKKSEQDWVFSEAEFDIVAAIMIERYKGLLLAEIFATSRPLTMLFAWSQAGDPDGPRALVENAIGDDEGLIFVLNGFISTVNTGDRGQFEVIQPSNLTSFIDIGSAKERLTKIDANNLSNDFAMKLKRIRDAFENGRSF